MRPGDMHQEPDEEGRDFIVVNVPVQPVKNEMKTESIYLADISPRRPMLGVAILAALAVGALIWWVV